MGAMKDLLYQAEQICDNCIRAPKLCGKCVINVLTTDFKGEQITVLLKGTNKKILKVEKACQKCGRRLTDRAIKKGSSDCWICQRKASKEKVNATETVRTMDKSK